MNSIKFKDLPKGQSFYWDEGDASLPAPKVKVGEYLYVDPTANGAKHPLRIAASDREVTVLVTPDSDKVAS